MDLRVQLAPFVGREAVLAEIRDRLQDSGCRLLMLVDPRGIAKMRLAMGAATPEVGRFKDGARLLLILDNVGHLLSIAPTVG